MQKPRKSKRKRSRVILKNYTLFAFLYCIARRYTAFILYCAALYRFLYCITRRYTAFYTALRGAIPYTALVRRYTAFYTALRGAIPLYTALRGAIPYTALVRRYTAMVSLVSSSSVTLFRVDTTSPVLLSISAAQ